MAKCNSDCAPFSLKKRQKTSICFQDNANNLTSLRNGLKQKAKVRFLLFDVQVTVDRDLCFARSCSVFGIGGHVCCTSLQRAERVWSGFYININLPTFFVQNFVQTTSTLCKEQRQLCMNNVNFARITTTLYEQCQLCTNNDNFARTTTTLCE